MINRHALFNTAVGDYERDISGEIEMYTYLSEAESRLRVIDAVPPDRRRCRDTTPGADMTHYRATGYEIRVMRGDRPVCALRKPSLA